MYNKKMVFVNENNTGWKLQKRSFKDMIRDKALKRQDEITKLLIDNGFTYDEASDSAFVIYENNQEFQCDKNIIKIAHKHIL